MHLNRRVDCCLRVTVLVALAALVACAPKATPTLFVAPTANQLPRTPVPASAGGAPKTPSAPPSIIVPSVVAPTATPPCTDNLTYIQDLTIPDGSNIAPGQSLDKRWQVTNSGTCNWDARYGLKLITGDAMGVAVLQPLYPARAGTKATLRILFTAPQSAGLYQCQWQAVGPDGQPFGDAFYMEIAVSP
jgi:hypothetical protein